MERHLFRPSITNSSDCGTCGLGKRELQEGEDEFLHTNWQAKIEVGFEGPFIPGKVYNVDTAPFHDPVTAPSHYLQTKITPLDVIEDWNLGFRLDSAIKYIGRHKYKGKPLEDLKKAQWYLSREIQLMEEQSNG